MQRNWIRQLALALIAVGLGLTTAACQDVHQFVTGDPFYTAPKSTVRVEVEVQVEVQDTFFDGLTGLDDADREELRNAIADEVMSIADMGLRFYPVLAQAYGAADARPERVMVVQIHDFDIQADDDLIEKEGQESYIESSVESMRCIATASVEKRRSAGPALVIGGAEGAGKVRPRKEKDEPHTRYGVKRETDDVPELFVVREDILDSVKNAVVGALRRIVKPIDRDLAGAQPAEDHGNE